MPHRPRHDEPGSRHHVINRGVSHRILVAGDADATRFLDFVAEYFDRHGVKILAYAILQTHFHLFVESGCGRLGDAMRCLESRYGRLFNLKNGRDGALVGRRYWSNRVRSLAYFRGLIEYIDQNPVDAGLCARAVDYPYSSRKYYGRPSGPSWLHRDPIEEFVQARSGRTTYDPADYDGALRSPNDSGRARWFSALIQTREDDALLLDEIIQATPEHVREWMCRCARNADGDVPPHRVVDPESILAAVDSLRGVGAELAVGLPRSRRPAGTLLRPGLLRQFAGITWGEIGSALGISISEARARALDHLTVLNSNSAYADLAAIAARGAIGRCHR